MKEIIIVLILVILVSGCINSHNVELDEQNSNQVDLECPRGLVNDPYPGSCGMYIDNNQNNICDYSE